MAIIHFISLVRKLSILASGFRIQYARRRSFAVISFDAETMGKHFKYQHIIPYKTLSHLYAFNFFLIIIYLVTFMGISGNKAGTKLTTDGSPRRVPARATRHLVETNTRSLWRAGARHGSSFSGLPCIRCGPISAIAISFFFYY